MNERVCKHTIYISKKDYKNLYDKFIEFLAVQECMKLSRDLGEREHWKDQYAKVFKDYDSYVIKTVRKSLSAMIKDGVFVETVVRVSFMMGTIEVILSGVTKIEVALDSKCGLSEN